MSNIDEYVDELDDELDDEPRRITVGELCMIYGNGLVLRSAAAVLRSVANASQPSAESSRSLVESMLEANWDYEAGDELVRAVRTRFRAGVDVLRVEPPENLLNGSYPDEG